MSLRFCCFETLILLLFIVVKVSFVNDQDASHNLTGDNFMNSAVFLENHFGNFKCRDGKLAVEKLAKGLKRVIVNGLFDNFNNFF